jgi:hypothetical protein
MQTVATITDGIGLPASPRPISAPLSAVTDGVGRTSRMGTLGGRLDDALLLLIAVFLVPVGILLIGSPIALCARLVLEIIRRL